MKSLITLLVLTALSLSAGAVETKSVCKTVKGKEVCKTIKIHKKIEDATAVPEKAPAKKKK
jgi:hypothetical protein